MHKVHRIALVLAFTLIGCGYFRSLLHPYRVPVEDDSSIEFPRLYDHFPVAVGAQEEMYELDGEMLRALVIAFNDYLPPDTKDLPCADRKEAQFYRVIRQGNIIFVYIHENFVYCGRQYPVRHQGGKYAISTDGRILRRLIGDQPEGPIEPETPDDGGRWISAEPGVSSVFDYSPRRDGGTAPSDSQPPPAADGGHDAG
jgi:hypothetical protein